MRILISEKERDKRGGKNDDEIKYRVRSFEQNVEHVA